jgi:D-tyrosyl-tRNA(Tyr) deacylase
MRAVIQRVSSASVTVDGTVKAAIEAGLLILLGIEPDDREADGAWLAKKIANLRIFPDAQARMNRSLLALGGAALVVSQFTLYGDCRKGRRPSFVRAAPPEIAEPLYQSFCVRLQESGVVQVRTGVFGAMMDVALVNDGPITLIIDTPVRNPA